MMYGVIFVRLFFIQVINHPFYQDLADRQYHVSLTQLPPRAPILDRNGAYLAMNKEAVSAFIFPATMKNRSAVETFLKEHFSASYDRLMMQSSSSFLFVKRKLTTEQLAIIKEANLSDIHLLQEHSRFYPVVSAGPVVGITDADNNGIVGIELFYNQILAGKSTVYDLEKDARSNAFYLTKTERKLGCDGNPIWLTIDADLQFLAYESVIEYVEKFEAKEGAALVMDPKTGEILAMVSVPSFDPNNASECSPEMMKNKCLTEAYELGSVMKICAALAALEEAVVTPEELIDCRNAKTAIIEGRRINTAFSAGRIPFFDVIAHSNNIGIAIVAKRLGTKLYDHYKKMGFGSKTGIAFPGEASGFLNPPNNWSKQSIISLSYGYEVTETLLQLAAFFSMIARDGYPVTPRLILENETKIDQKEPIYRPETIAAIKTILEETTNSGTARRAGIRGYRVMSKTGTAILAVNGAYDRSKNVYTCAGIVEKDSYQRVIIAFIKESKRSDIFASLVAAPLFETIAERMLIHDRV